MSRRRVRARPLRRVGAAPRLALALALGLAGALPALPASAQSPAPDPAPSAPAWIGPASATGPDGHWTGPALPTKPMSAEDAAAIDALFAQALASTPDLPGIWVGVWHPEKGVHIAAYGKAAVNGPAATVADHGRIGSITKTFTATAVLEEVAKGTFALDSTIAQLLPDLATAHPEVGGITVEQLLGMRSGIPDYGNTAVVIPRVIADPAHVWTPDELIEAAFTLPLQPPGTAGYSTTNTQILAKILEKTTGATVESLVNGIAARAGMTNSALDPADDSTMPDPASRGYLFEAGAKSVAEIGGKVAAGTDVTDWSMSWGGAGGGMYSTIEDMGRWAATGLGTSFLPAELGARRLRAEPGPAGRYGLGIIDWGNGWIGHTGQVLGWEAVIAYDTRTGAAYAVIVNEGGSILSGFAPAATIFPSIVRAFLG